MPDQVRRSAYATLTFAPSPVSMMSPSRIIAGTMMAMPKALISRVRELIAKHKKSA